MKAYGPKLFLKEEKLEDVLGTVYVNTEFLIIPSYCIINVLRLKYLHVILKFVYLRSKQKTSSNYNNNNNNNEKKYIYIFTATFNVL